MLSISPGHSAGYLTDTVGAGMEGYYTGAVGAGEPPGVWWGDGAAQLGMVGAIDADVMHAVFDQFLDPRHPAFADPATRDQAAVLGRPSKRFRTPEAVLAARVEAYSAEHGSTPTPEQVQAWRIEAERTSQRAVLFFDATFSPPKSVTVAHAAFSRAMHEARDAGDHAAAAQWQAKIRAMDAAIWEANESLLTYLAEHGGYARTGRHTGRGGTGQWTDAHDLVVGRFYQHTSRDHDPQLHIHNAILNKVPCADDVWRGLDGRSLHSVIQGAGAVGSAVLQARLTERLGVSWVLREDGNDFEIAGINQDVMDLFSSRRKTLTRKAQQLIDRAESQLGRPLNSLQRTRLSLQASLSTRAAKTHDSETEQERVDRWDAMLRTEVAGGLMSTARRLDDRRPPDAAAWSAEAVISQALEAVHGGEDGPGRSVWGRHELQRRIHLALPANLGLSPAERVELLSELTDLALERAVLVSGREIGDVPCPDRLANGMSAAAAPYARRYASPGHLAAEVALLDQIGERGRARIEPHALADWLQVHAPQLTPAQRQAVEKTGSSDAALAVLIGPAGTGKSYTAGVLAEAWAELAGGRVIGLATAETAAQVLVDDGLVDSANIAAFLAAQARIADGRPKPGDERWQVGERDILAVDEASMLDTSRLTELRNVADQAGARLLLMGDPHQLAAVGAGGMMRTAVEHGAETYTLSEVRRFTAGWEGDASLQLRDGEPAAVLAYDRAGRLRDAGTLDQAIAAVAKAAAADRLAGQEVIVTCASNEQAAAVAAAVRRHLVDVGLVEETGTVLGRDGSTAGVGDRVQARRIDRALGLVNRETYRVIGVRADGGLDVESVRTGLPHVMPSDYVRDDVTLAYASTAHAAQGATVDAGHILLTSQLDRAGAYVGLTRGRGCNTAWAVTVTAPAIVSGRDAEQPPATTARAILDGLIRGDGEADSLREVADWSAVDTMAVDERHRTSARTILARIEDQTRLACRERLDADLDQLAAEGLISPEERARFGAEQGTEYLARQLRALETAGHDPAALLREAVAFRDYTGAVALAPATSARIEKAYGLSTPDPAAGTPARIHPTRAEYLDALHEALTRRGHELAVQVATEQPRWALDLLGPIPEVDDDRADWLDRAAKVALTREATDWDHPEAALGRCPGASAPEKRLTWSQAWAAAGMPEERRAAADLSDGRLRVRVAAGERVEAHAPAAVHEQQRLREHEAADRRHEAALARAAGREEEAARLELEATDAAQAAARLDLANQARAQWLLAHAETLHVAHEAREEARRRALPLGREADRGTAASRLDEQHTERAAERAEDAERVITDADVDDRPRDLDQAGAQVDDRATVVAPESSEVPPKVSAAAAGAETLAAATHAAARLEQLADQASQEQAAAAGVENDEWHRRRRQASQTATASDTPADMDRGDCDAAQF